MNWKNAILFSGFILLLFSACESDKGKHIPDVSHISVDTDLRRFEQDFFSLDTNNLSNSIEAIKNKYPEFGKIYFDNFLNIPFEDSLSKVHAKFINGYVYTALSRHLRDTCQIVFGDMNDLKKEFDQAFQYFQYYFPNEPIPTVTTYISEFTLANFIYQNNALAVSLDFFLGAQYPYREYNPGIPNFSNYLIRSFNKDHLVAKTLKPLVQDLLGAPTGDKMLDAMIHNGKEIYILDQLIPYAPDSVKTDYSQEQLEWVVSNEMDIWVYFISENLIYSTDWGTYRKFVEASPHSPGMPPEAPGRTANWLGWQIVKKYMDRYPETTLEELIAIKDAQLIMDKSKYKPKK